MFKFTFYFIPATQPSYYYAVLQKAKSLSWKARLSQNNCHFLKQKVKIKTLKNAFTD